MISDVSRRVGKTDLAVSSSHAGFSNMLSRTIESIRNDPAQLRNVIYELTRVKLQRECLLHNPPLTVLETRRLMLALETSIERVERTCAQTLEAPTLQSVTQAIDGLQAHSAKAAIETASVAPVIVDVSAATTAATAPAAGAPADNPHSVGGASKWIWSTIALPVRACGLAVVAVAIFAVISGELGLSRPSRHFPFLQLGEPRAPLDLTANASSTTPSMSSSTSPRLQSAAAEPQQASPVQQVEKVRPAAPSTLPSVYGVYAVSDGKLYEVEPLRGRVPDPRVFMSWTITKPSHTIIPSGKISFVVYQRDLARSAPDHVAVRVIARIMRDMTFNVAGAANTAPVEDAWTIRNISYDFRVAPVDDNPEMLMVKNENPDFVLPAGRYGLVLKGQAYDFTVAGPITEPAQCLERVEASNGSFYNECKNP